MPQPFRMPPPNRVPPALPVTSMKTYAISSPLSTHWRPATCAEVECPEFVHGWRTIVPSDSAAADYIRHDRTRRHAETHPDAGLACFTFEPGQHGFSPQHDHQVRTGRPEKYLVRGGDWRGNPAGDRRVLGRAADWVDDFANHQDRLQTAIERG